MRPTTCAVSRLCVFLLFGLILIVASAAIATAAAQGLPAFLGAEGWGAANLGGRGGQVIYVTSLADRGPGTLREAVMTQGPRTVLFRVGGIIYLESPLFIGGGGLQGGEYNNGGDNPYSYLTIAGQTAPGGGICLTGRVVILNNGVHDVVLRYLRIRNTVESTDDCLNFRNGAHNILVDHCSFSWGADETTDFAVATDITLSNCIIAEGLANGPHVKGEHSMGMLVTHGADRLSLHHNYFASNGGRNPKLDGANITANGYYWGDRWVLHPVFDLRNNVVYNWKYDATSVNYGAHANVVGNVYVPGPSTLGNRFGIYVRDMPPYSGDGTLVYVDDNIGETKAANTDDPWSRVFVDTPEVDRDARWGGKPGEYRAMEPFPAPPVTTVPSAEAAELVLSAVGAWPRDETDARLVEEFRTGTGAVGAPDRRWYTPLPTLARGIAPADNDEDGMPDEWEAAHGLNADDPADGAQDANGDGYTNLEDYLEARATEVSSLTNSMLEQVEAQVMAAEAESHQPGIVNTGMQTIYRIPLQDIHNEPVADVMVRGAGFTHTGVCSLRLPDGTDLVQEVGGVARLSGAWDCREWQWWRGYEGSTQMRPRNTPATCGSDVTPDRIRVWSDYTTDGVYAHQQWFFTDQLDAGELHYDCLTTIENQTGQDLLEYGEFFASYTSLNGDKGHWFWDSSGKLINFKDIGGYHIDRFIVDADGPFPALGKIPNCPRGDGLVSGTWRHPVLVSHPAPDGRQHVIMCETATTAGITMGMQGIAMDYILYPGGLDFKAGQSFSAHIRHYIVALPEGRETQILERLWNEFEASHDRIRGWARANAPGGVAGDAR